MDIFFALGDKATGGDPKRKAAFDYYLMWIMMIAFFVIAGSNLNAFITTGRWSYLGWFAVLLCIAWFQYGSLKMAREARILMEKMSDNAVYDKIEDIDDMLEMTGDKPKAAKKVKAKNGKRKTDNKNN